MDELNEMLIHIIRYFIVELFSFQDELDYN